MEYIQYIDEFYHLSTKVGDLPSFKEDRAKEIKELTKANVQIDGIYAKRSIKVLKVSKVKLEQAEDDGNKVWHFSCKAVLRLLD